MPAVRPDRVGIGPFSTGIFMFVGKLEHRGDRRAWSVVWSPTSSRSHGPRDKRPRNDQPLLTLHRNGSHICPQPHPGHRLPRSGLRPPPVCRRSAQTLDLALLCLGMVTAAGTLGSIAAAAARVPALTTLATAATARKRRRVGSRGGNIIGWSIADVFVGGVLSTLSAWVIGSASFVARVRAGAEVHASPRLAFVIP
jgi:hypothetical protein